MGWPIFEAGGAVIGVVQRALNAGKLSGSLADPACRSTAFIDCRH